MGVIYRNISKEDLLSFMDKSNIEYSIPRESYRYIFNNYYDAVNTIKKFNMAILDDFYGDRFPNIKKALSDTITPSLVYDEGWRLEITTDNIINSILYSFGSSYRVKRFNDDNSESKKKRVIREFGDIKNRMYTFDINRLNDSLSYEITGSFKDKGRDFSNLREEICGFITNTKYLIADDDFDYIYDNNIGDVLDDYYEPKNLLYTLAVSSLLKLAKYKDKDYNLLPNTYYERISKVGSSPFAKTTVINKRKYFGYDVFNKMYNEIKNNTDLLDRSVIDNIDILFDKFIFIKDGEGYDKQKVTCRGRNKFQLKEENLKELRDKKRFFADTNYKHRMIGVDSLDGYMGFVYDNNYIIFERFYRDKNRSKPAHGEAIYVMPADKLLLSLSNKQEIMEYIKSNPDSGVFRIIHKGDNYKDKVNSVINSQDISTESFDDIYNRMKKSGKILVKSK